MAGALQPSQSERPGEQELQARGPGDPVEVDTLDVRPSPGAVLKHFTARDVVSRSQRLPGYPCGTRRRTHTEEFYEVTHFPLEVAPLNQELKAWEHVYNTVRPHQALDYLTPYQPLTQWQHQREEADCH